MPDAGLFAAAQGNTLKGDGLTKEVDRLLADGKMSRFIDDFPRHTVGHGTPVVRRVVERVAGGDQSVQQRDLDADRGARPQLPDDPALRLPVEIQGALGIVVEHRDHVRLSLDREPHMCDQPARQDRGRKR